MPQLDFDGANSKVSADKIQGQSGTTVAVETGHNISVGGVNVVAVAPSTSGNVLTSTGSAWASSAAAVGGKVLQCVSVTKVDPTTTNSTSFVTISGLTVSCTPTSTSSTFLLQANVSHSSNSGVGGSYRFLRSYSGTDTAVGIGDASGVVTRATIGSSDLTATYQMYMMSMQFMDTTNASDTSTSLSYSVQWQTRNASYGFTLNKQTGETDNDDYQRLISQITLWEIGA